MSRKDLELIEDSDELRGVIADLQAKVAEQKTGEVETQEIDATSEDASDAQDKELYVQGDYYEEAYDSSYDSSYDEYDSDLSEFDDSVKEPEVTKAPEPVKTVERKPSRRRKRARRDNEVIISMDGVTHEYVKGVPALKDVNIKIRRGEFVFIVGDSGSGKSTFIKLLLRELKPTSGSIMVNGFQVDKLRNGKVPLLRRSLGVVFQDFRLLKDRNVYENVAFAQRIIQTSHREIKRNVPSMLGVVGLAGKYKAMTSELSGGEQQRVALARALVNKPPILLADEPTGNLDPKNTYEIMSLLEQINKNGTTVIVVTHNDKIVNDMQKRVITIKKGIVISDDEKGGYIDED